MHRNKIVYIITLISVFGVMVMYPDYYTVLTFKVILIVPVVTRFILYLISKGVSAQFNIKKQILQTNEEGIPIKITLANKSWFPLSAAEAVIEYKSVYQQGYTREKTAVSTVGRESVTTTYYLNTPIAGVVYIHIKGLYLYDYLKIWKSKINTDFSIKSVVMPKMQELMLNPNYINDNFEIETDNYSKNKPGNDSSSVFGIRDYMPGDQVRSIHWKLSSKKDEMIVKEFSLPITKQPLIYAELCKPVIGKENYSISKQFQIINDFMSLTASLSLTLAQNDFDHYLGWYDQEYNDVLRYEVSGVNDVDLGVADILHARLYDEPMGIEVFKSKYQKDSFSHLFYICNQCSLEMLEEIAFNNERIKVTIIIVNRYLDKEYTKSLHINCEKNGIVLIVVDKALEYNCKLACDMRGSKSEKYIFYSP